MNDRALKVLEQYELEVTGTRRGRGSYILDTPQGIRILMDYNGSEHKAQFQNRLLRQIQEGGYEKVDEILPDKEGRMISRDWEGNQYVVKKWYMGRECDTSNELEIMAAVSNLARLHRLMHLDTEESAVPGRTTGKSEEASYRTAEPQRAAQCQRAELETERQAAGQGDEAPYRTAEPQRAAQCQRAELEAENQAEPDKMEEEPGEGAEAEIPKSDAEVLADFEKCFTAQPPLAELRAQNAELRKIRSFIRKKNDKGDFERQFLNCFSLYFDQAYEAERKLEQKFGMQDISRSVLRGSVCHGDYDHHHVLMSGYDMATINFEYCRFDYQAADLYRFMRKILEKHDWSPRLGMRMLDCYTAIRPLSAEERQLFYIRMLYPEKFRKLANHYYGRNKAWISRSFLDKLEALNRQQEKREKFVKMLEK